MHKDTILHIMVPDKFLAPFIDFVDDNFGRENHHYIFITPKTYQYGLTPKHDVEFLHTDDDIFIHLLAYMNKVKKIIVHGLWRDSIDKLLLQNPDLFNKTYWVMWGGDFYFPENQTIIRHKVIKNITKNITYLNKDIDYVSEIYDATPSHKNCNMYPTCIPQTSRKSKKILAKGTINILVGNSATDTNNHLEIFEILKEYSKNNINLIVPLSYGDKQYKDKIIQKGQELFGQKFNPLTEFLKFSKYLEVLNSIDIAIFNHKRQQAGGNLNILLGYGKTVYLSSDSPYYAQYLQMGIKVLNNKKFNLNLLSKDISKNNSELIANEFSIKTLYSQWKTIFEEEV